jgi:hypothetical protein
LHTTSPNEPSKLRLRVWRELKRAGALYPPFSFCILPKTAKSMEHASNLKNKIKEYGKAVILEAKAISEEDHNTIITLFQAERGKTIRRDTGGMSRIPSRNRKQHSKPKADRRRSGRNGGELRRA